MQFSKQNVCLMAAAALIVGGLQAQAALVNGSFEEPALETNSWIVLGANSTAINGWTMVAPESTVLHINSRGPGGNATQISPQHGNQMIELDGGDVGASVYIEQTLTGLSIGTEYSLTGYYGWTWRAGAEIGWFKVELDDTELMGRTSAYNWDTHEAWTGFDLRFTATDESHTVRFVSLGANYGQHVGLDNIAVTAVPEPATAGALGLVSAMAFFGRRRSRCSAR